MKYIKLVLDNLNIKPNSEIKGHVTVNYPGAYDGIVINTLIMDSNELIVYTSYNDEKISDNVSRLFISRDVMPDNKAQFTAVIEFEPEQLHEDLPAEALLVNSQTSHYIGLWRVIMCGEIIGHGHPCVPVFQVNTPVVFITEGDVITLHWTVLRIIN